MASSSSRFNNKNSDGIVGMGTTGMGTIGMGTTGIPEAEKENYFVECAKPMEVQRLILQNASSSSSVASSMASSMASSSSMVNSTANSSTSSCSSAHSHGGVHHPGAAGGAGGGGGGACHRTPLKNYNYGGSSERINKSSSSRHHHPTIKCSNNSSSSRDHLITKYASDPNLLAHSFGVINRGGGGDFAASTPCVTPAPGGQNHGLLSNTSSIPTPTNPSSKSSSQYGEELELHSTLSTPQRNVFRTPLRTTRTDSSIATNSTADRFSSPIAGNSSSNNSKMRTPSGPRFNPFDVHVSAENLQLPMMSPSLFKTVLSPSQEESNDFWTLEQRANLFPVHISEDSPWKQETLQSNVDPEVENQTQDAIDRYFKQHHKITSPLVDVIDPDLGRQAPVTSSPELQRLSSPSSGPAASESVEQWTQTVVTFPPKLPPDVEEILAKYSTFNQSQEGQQQQQSTSMIDQENISNLSLRRKLFANMKGDDDDDDEDHNETSGDEDDNVSPVRMISPGKIIYTPTNAPMPSGHKKWTNSTSPVSSRNARRTTFTPPNQMGSPLFSPISRTGGTTSTLSGLNSFNRTSNIREQRNRSSDSSPVSSRKTEDTSNILMTSVIDGSDDEETNQGERRKNNDPTEILYCDEELTDQDMDENMDIASSAANSPVKRQLSIVFEEEASNGSKDGACGGVSEDLKPSVMSSKHQQHPIPMRSRCGSAMSMDTDSLIEKPEINGACSSTKMTLDNLTSSMTFNDLSEVTLPSHQNSDETCSMGYHTQSSSSSNSSNQASSNNCSTNPNSNYAYSSAMSTIAEDSGHVTNEKSVPFELFGQPPQVEGGASANLNPSQRASGQQQHQKSYMVSYGVDESNNDISVGFPLGSSTPTK